MPVRVEDIDGTFGFSSRWRLYFRERFPLPLQAPVIAVFSSSVFVYASAIRSHSGRPSLTAVAAAFVVVLLTFLQLRILDEFKDYEQDMRFRPYRPVPRGIVTLRELGWLGVVATFAQVAASALVGTRALVALAVVWVYAGLMAAEFFVPAWLRAHPLVYMASHMAVIPLIVAYVATCAGAETPTVPLMWLAGMSYLSFCVFEIGRKIRAPADEQEGVDTYSALWGRRSAVIAWLLAMAGAGAFAALAARHVGTWPVAAGLAAAVIVLAAAVGTRFLAEPQPGRGQWFFTMSGVWLVVMYLGLGVGAWMSLP
ncbi:MAG TPA: UbiA family prenyltransferase [Burkholderiaceae bacterium]|nr:UbiA family prenyltransferase [Burkholderiaceae bacterium]